MFPTMIGHHVPHRDGDDDAQKGKWITGLELHKKLVNDQSDFKKKKNGPQI